MEKYFEVLKTINEKNIDITKLYILSCVENVEERVEKLDYIYDTWLEIDEDICLARLCDIVNEHWEEIKEDSYTQEDIEFELFS